MAAETTREVRSGPVCCFQLPLFWAFYAVASGKLPLVSDAQGSGEKSGGRGQPVLQQTPC